MTIQLDGTIVSTTTLGTLAKRSKNGSIEPEIPLSELVEKLADGRTALRLGTEQHSLIIQIPRQPLSTLGA